VSAFQNLAPAAASPAAGAARPRVIGADLSLTASGIASTLGWTDLIGTNGITKLPAWERSDNITTLAHQIADLAKSANLVVIEQVSAAKAYGGASERAGLFWEVARLLRGRGIPFAEATPAQLKLYATGKGQCPKGTVIDAVARRWPAFETKGDDNLCDAVVLCAMGADHLGAPLADVPKAHRAALGKIAWPEVP
jgi:Holliday junction resolvasome RuvABC endonuclease subunit